VQRSATVCAFAAASAVLCWTPRPIRAQEDGGLRWPGPGFAANRIIRHPASLRSRREEGQVLPPIQKGDKMGAGVSLVHARLQRIREEEGEEAYRRALHGAVGGYVGAAAGAATGATIGSMLLPGPGSVVGLVVGTVIGASRGSRDETAGDNVNRAGGLGARIVGWWNSPGS
jgi:hypothetical protein